MGEGEGGGTKKQDRNDKKRKRAIVCSSSFKNYEVEFYVTTIDRATRKKHEKKKVTRTEYPQQCGYNESVSKKRRKKKLTHKRHEGYYCCVH